MEQLNSQEEVDKFNAAVPAYQPPPKVEAQAPDPVVDFDLVELESRAKKMCRDVMTELRSNDELAEAFELMDETNFQGLQRKTYHLIKMHLLEGVKNGTANTTSNGTTPNTTASSGSASDSPKDPQAQ